MKLERQKVEQQKQLIKTAYNPSKLRAFYGYDEANIAPEGQPLRTVGVSQNWEFPTIYGARKDVLHKKFQLSKSNMKIQEQQLSSKVAKAYQQLLYQKLFLKSMNILIVCFKPMTKVLSSNISKEELIT